MYYFFTRVGDVWNPLKLRSCCNDDWALHCCILSIARKNNCHTSFYSRAYMDLYYSGLGVSSSTQRVCIRNPVGQFMECHRYVLWMASDFAFVSHLPLAVSAHTLHSSRCRCYNPRYSIMHSYHLPPKSPPPSLNPKCACPRQKQSRWREQQFCTYHYATDCSHEYCGVHFRDFSLCGWVFWSTPAHGQCMLRLYLQTLVALGTKFRASLIHSILSCTSSKFLHFVLRLANFSRFAFQSKRKLIIRRLLVHIPLSSYVLVLTCTCTHMHRVKTLWITIHFTFYILVNTVFYWINFYKTI